MFPYWVSLLRLWFKVAFRSAKVALLSFSLARFRGAKGDCRSELLSLSERRLSHFLLLLGRLFSNGFKIRC